MSKKMLMNATHTEEVRVAIVENGKLINLDIEPIGKEPEKANIYKGIITSVERSLEAAFVNYGAERHGFLPFREIAREYFATDNVQSKPDVKAEIREGQEIIIQVEKEQRGNKGAALTTFPSLAGSYIVFMPNKPKGGISKRIDGEDRNESKEALSKLTIPENAGVILRTAGLGRSQEELQWDLDVLVNLWNAIQNAAQLKKGPFLLHKEGNVVIRAIRDHLRPDIEEILIDNQQVFEEACAHIKVVRPEFINKVRLYNDPAIPLFNKFGIEKQIESAFLREVRLPSGGAIVIDHTEALISIDINSSKATHGTDIENTAFQTNMEASEEIARQLRLRDLGGLIVIDYIDMAITKNQRAVENQLRDSLTLDRARVQVGRISRFGLLEMSRQRLRPALSESREITCPRCSGQGTIHSIEALSLIIMRVLEEEAMKEETTAVKAELPVELATFIINEKRANVLAIEKRQNVRILILPNPHLITPKYIIEKMSPDEKAGDAVALPSYKMINKPEQQKLNPFAFNKNYIPQRSHSEPAVIMAATQAPKPKPGTFTHKAASSLIKKLWTSIVGSNSNTAAVINPIPKTEVRAPRANQNKAKPAKPMAKKKASFAQEAPKEKSLSKNSSQQESSRSQKNISRNQPNKMKPLQDPAEKKPAAPKQHSKKMEEKPLLIVIEDQPVKPQTPIVVTIEDNPIQAPKVLEDVTVNLGVSNSSSNKRNTRRTNRKPEQRSNTAKIEESLPVATWKSNEISVDEQPPIHIVVEKE